MATQINKSVLAIVLETTEGTPVSPTSATQYIAVEEGYSVTPEFDSLDNNELTGNIGQAKSITGFESGTASLDHYLKHSGTEGTAPEYNLLIKSGFGDSATQATERLTAAGSTAGTTAAAGIVNIAAGQGVEYERGKALLIKDPLNGYRIRCVQSIATDALTLNFNLPSAPAASVALGKAVLYKPANSNHPTVSLWDYRGNGGAVQMLAGARVTEMSVDATAGELLNASFSLQAVNGFYNPVEITSTDTKLDFNETGPTLRAATIAAGFYKTPHHLAAAVQLAMNDVATDVITVTYSDITGYYTISTAGSLLSLLFTTGTNAANSIHDKMGYTAADKTGALTYTSSSAYTLTSPQTATYDSNDPLVVKYNEVMVGDFDDYACFSTRSLKFTLANEVSAILDICAESGKSGTLVTKRTVTVDVVANLPVYDADKFERMRTNSNCRFQYSFGTKTGGNWNAGKSGCIYLPTASITKLNLSDGDGQVTMELSLKAYVSAGLGEVYLNFV